MSGADAPVPYQGLHTDDDLELFGPYRELFPITIEGQRFYVPEDNSLLRSLQFVELKHGAFALRWASFCWNDTKGCCDVQYRRSAQGELQIGRACCIQVRPGMVIECLPAGATS